MIVILVILEGRAAMQGNSSTILAQGIVIFGLYGALIGAIVGGVVAGIHRAITRRKPKVDPITRVDPTTKQNVP